MKTGLITFVVALILFGDANAQYQKMAKSNSVNVSGFGSHLNLSWTKQMTNRNSLTLGGFYFSDNSKAIDTDNLGVDVNFDRWVWRLGSFYISSGSGIFLNHTNAQSAAGGHANDINYGFNLRGEVEFYPVWWFVFAAQANQMIFLGSEFFNSKFVLGLGVKVVF